MNHFTIKDIENLTGIKAHTLRIWEKRYNIIQPKRKESLQRFYDNEDLKQILRIAHLYNNGYKISAIANLHDYKVEVYETEKDHAEEALTKILIEAAVEVNETLFNKTIQQSFDKFGVETAMIKVVYPYLEKIGLLWMNNEALAAQERFASNLILKKLINETEKLNVECDKTLSSVLLFTPPQEYHELPLLFMHYLLKRSCHHVYYVGANTNFEVLDAFIETTKPGTLMFHLITCFIHKSLDAYVRELTQRYPKQTIVMSGKFAGNITIKADNLKLLCSLNEMLAFCNGAF
jgi:DNA-binding transcriptional MerR regulator